MLNVGDRSKVKSGPFKGKSFVVLKEKWYETKEDKKRNAHMQGGAKTGWYIPPDPTGRIYKVRFDDGLMSEIVDTEL